MAVLPSSCRRYIDGRGIPFEELQEGGQKALVLKQFGLPTGRFDTPSTRPPNSAALRLSRQSAHMFYANPWLKLAASKQFPCGALTSHSSSRDAGGSDGRATTTNGAPASMAFGPCSSGSRRRWSARHEPRRSDHPGSGPRRATRACPARRRDGGRRLCVCGSAAFNPTPGSGEAGAVSPSMSCYRFHAKTRCRPARRMSPGSPRHTSSFSSEPRMKVSCPASFTRTRADLRNFPGRDDRNEKDLLQLARNRNGDEAALVQHSAGWRRPGEGAAMARLPRSH